MFLHGFLGTGEEWIPIMKGISGSARCISVDIPGHGSSRVQSHASETQQVPTFSMEMIAKTLYKLIEQITHGKVTVVGYSMGARIALYMALRFSNKVGSLCLKIQHCLIIWITEFECCSVDRRSCCGIGEPWAQGSSGKEGSKCNR